MDTADIPAMPIDGRDALARRFAGFVTPVTSDMTAYLVDAANLENRLLSLPPAGRRLEARSLLSSLLNTQVFERSRHAVPSIISEFKEILEEHIELEPRQALRLSLASKIILRANLSLPDFEESVPRKYQKGLLLEYAQCAEARSSDVDKTIEPGILFSRWVLRSISRDLLAARPDSISVHVARLEASLEMTAVSSFSSSEISAAEWVRQLSADLAELYIYVGNFQAAKDSSRRFFAAETENAETLSFRRPYFSDYEVLRMQHFLEVCELATAVGEREQAGTVAVPVDCKLRRLLTQKDFGQESMDLLLFGKLDPSNFMKDVLDWPSKRMLQSVVETVAKEGTANVAARIAFCNALAASLAPPCAGTSACLENMLEELHVATFPVLGAKQPAAEEDARWFLTTTKHFQERVAQYKNSLPADTQRPWYGMLGNAEPLAEAFMQMLCRFATTPVLWRLIQPTERAWNAAADVARERTEAMAAHFADCATSAMLDASYRNETVHGRLRRLDAADIEKLASGSMMPPQVARVYLAAEQYRKDQFRRSMAVNTLIKREESKEDPDFKTHIQEIESRVEWSFFGFKIQEAMTMDWWAPDASQPLSAELLHMKKESFVELANRLAQNKYECPDVKILELFVAFCFKHEQYMYLVRTLPTLLNYAPAFEGRTGEISITEWSSKDGQLYLTIAVVLGLILPENNIAASEAGFIATRPWVNLPFDRLVNFLNLPEKMKILAQKGARGRVLKTFATVGEPIYIYLLASLLAGILCRIDAGNQENHQLRAFFGGPAALMVAPNFLANEFTADEKIPSHFGQPQLEEKLAPIFQTAKDNQSELVTALSMTCEQLVDAAARSPLSMVCLMHAYLVKGQHLDALSCWLEGTGELRRSNSERGDPGEQASLGAPELAGRDLSSAVWDERVISAAIYCCQRLEEPLYAAVLGQFQRVVPYPEMITLVRTAVEKYGIAAQSRLAGADGDDPPYGWLNWFWDITMLEFIAATFKKTHPDALGRVTRRIFRLPQASNPSCTFLTLNSQTEFFVHMTRRLARMSALVVEEKRFKMETGDSDGTHLEP